MDFVWVLPNSSNSPNPQTFAGKTSDLVALGIHSSRRHGFESMLNGHIFLWLQSSACETPLCLSQALAQADKSDKSESNPTGSDQTGLEEHEMDEVEEFPETWTEGKDITPFHFEILDTESDFRCWADPTT